MKKLMFTAAVVACATVAMADGITSQNIVGYNSRNSGGDEMPIVGGMFVPVSGEATIDLSDLKMEMESNESGDNYLDPVNDYIRFMNPNSGALPTDSEYCYIGQEFLDLIECSDKTQAIGWWKHDYEAAYDELIGEDDYSLKVTTAVPIKVGQGVLGEFLTVVGDETHKVRLVSSGSVPLEATAFNSAGNEMPLMVNYLPTDTTLFNITMSMKANESGDNYLDPVNDYIRFMDPNSGALPTDSEYCYIGQEFLDLIECSEKTDAIGWWKHDYEAAYDELIGDDDYSLKLTDDIDLVAGSGFLGEFLVEVGEETHEVQVNYKDALHAK